MVRVVVRLPKHRALIRAKSTTVASRWHRPADASLADKFNLAALNGGKNPFETPSERLLRPATRKFKNDAEMRDVYSLEYLAGKSETAVPKQKTQPKKNPFDVASDKLM
jgi:hypothetical protein